MRFLVLQHAAVEHPGVLRDFLRAVVAAGIDYHDFTEAGNRFQTTRQIVGLVIRENDDGR